MFGHNRSIDFTNKFFENKHLTTILNSKSILEVGIGSGMSLLELTNTYLEKKSELKSLSGNLLLSACSVYKQKINNNDYEIIKHAKNIFESERTDFTQAVERILDINNAYIEVEKLKLE